MKNAEITGGKVLYGVGFGALVAGAYLFVRLNDVTGGLALFGVGSLVIFLMHLVIWPTHTLKGLLNKKMLIRGLMYGGTQVLIFKAQAAGHTTTALVSATMGSVFGVILGRLVLGERLRGIAVIAAIVCFAAVFLDPVLILKSYWGVIGGFIQGSGWVLARSIMIERGSMRQTISSGFLVGGTTALVAYFLAGEPLSGLLISGRNLAIVVVIALCIQYAFFHLYKVLDAQRASMLTLSRIPWSISAEYFLVGIVLKSNQLISSGLILVGSLLLYLDAKVALRRKR